jgi:hypothetical protein
MEPPRLSTGLSALPEAFHAQPCQNLALMHKTNARYICPQVQHVSKSEDGPRARYLDSCKSPAIESYFLVTYLFYGEESPKSGGAE